MRISHGTKKLESEHGMGLSEGRDSDAECGQAKVRHHSMSMSMSMSSTSKDDPDGGGWRACAARTAALIPVLNEEGLIGEVVGRLLGNGVGWVVVVDNGSTDRSAEAASRAGAVVVHEPVRGYGQACWTGMQHLPDGCEFVVFAAGDGQDNVSDLPLLLEEAQRADVVIGDRTATESSRRWLTVPQRWGNWLATTLMYLGWGRLYRDLGAFRVLRRAALEGLRMEDRGFGWTVEMQVKAAQEHRGLRVSEVPVEYCPRLKGQSKISGTIKGTVQAGTIILLTIAKLYTQELTEVFTQPLLRSKGTAEASEALKGGGGGAFRVLAAREQSVWEGLPRWRRRCAALAAVLLLIGSLQISLSNDTLEPGSSHRFAVGCLVQLAGFGCLLAVPALPWPLLWATACAVRLLMLTSTNLPGDDVYRFVWEGWMQLQGVSPYAHPPKSPAADALLSASHSPYMLQVRNSCNHPTTTSIYPPMAQIFFGFAAALAPRVQHFKLIVTAFDMAITWVLSRQFGARRAALYGWNPLVLLCAASGGHYDPAFVLPLVLAWLAFERGHWKLSSFLVGVSASMKWVSAPLLGFIAIAVGDWAELLQGACAGLAPFSSKSPSKGVPSQARLCSVLSSSLRRGLVAGALGLLPLAASAAPYCRFSLPCQLMPLESPWALKARRNAFLPFLATRLGPPWMASLNNFHFAAAFVPVLLLLLLREAWQSKQNRMRRFAVFGETFLLAMLLFAPVVHFWYFTWGLPFAASTGTRYHAVATFAVSLSFLPVLYPKAPHGLIQAVGMWTPIFVSAVWPQRPNGIPGAFGGS